MSFRGQEKERLQSFAHNDQNKLNMQQDYGEINDTLKTKTSQSFHGVADTSKSESKEEIKINEDKLKVTADILPDETVDKTDKLMELVQDIQTSETNKNNKSDEVEANNENIENPEQKEYDSDDAPDVLASDYIRNLVKTNVYAKKNTIVEEESQESEQDESHHSNDEVHSGEVEEINQQEQVSEEVVEVQIPIAVQKVITEVMKEAVPVIKTEPKLISFEALDAAYSIMHEIAMNFNKIVFNEDSESEYEEEESEEDDQNNTDIIVSKVEKIAPQPVPKANLFTHRRETEDPHTMVKYFTKNDGESVKAVKIDILQQAEQLQTKLHQRRKKLRYPVGKRLSILHPGGSNYGSLSQSFCAKDMEDTLATDSLHNFGYDHPHSFQIEHNDENEFKEIFKVLDELEDDSNIFGNLNTSPAVGSGPQDLSPEEEKKEEYEQKKEEFLDKYKIKKAQELSEIKKTYDDEISKLKEQGKNALIKGMIKNVKKEREEAVERVKDKFNAQKEEYLANLRKQYSIEEE